MEGRESRVGSRPSEHRYAFLCLSLALAWTSPSRAGSDSAATEHDDAARETTQESGAESNSAAREGAPNADVAPTSDVTEDAANKATARAEATRGLELFRDQHYAEALDKLVRAQALYDAPVHLLYIARCQTALGQLVEAAETYRTLGKTRLAADAPPAFAKAVEEGARELEALQPRIPSLLVRLQPEDAANPSLFVDDKPVPAAAIGIARLINPGRHRVRIDADGFATKQAEIDVPEGALTELELSLLPQQTQDAPADAPAEASVEAAGAPSRSFLDSVAFLLGARFGIAAPAGQLPGSAVHPQRTADLRFADTASAGGEFELRVGTHFLDRWGIFAFLNLQQLGGKQAVFTEQLTAVGGDVSFAPGQPGVGSLGLSVLGGTARGEFGAFAELGLAFVHRMTYETDLSVGAGGNLGCSGNVETQGLAGRLSLGMNVPLRRRLIHLTPYLTWQLGGVSSVTYSGPEECPGDGFSKIDVTEGPAHSVISFGVGGDFYIGGN